MTDQPKMKVVFAPGCFDSFDGTQEELDELVASIMKMAETGEILENAVVIDPTELGISIDDIPGDQEDSAQKRLLN